MQVRRAAGAIGAFIDDLDLARAARDSGLFAELQQALYTHEVIFLRDQRITPIEYQSLARRFGPIEGHPAYDVVADAPDVQILESTPERPSKIELWHTDMTFRPAPPCITLLHGQVIPPCGGDTLWASTTAAYAALSAPMQHLVEGLTAVHDFRHGFRESLAEPGGAERLAGAIAANPPVRHPVVRIHPHTGRKALYVNRLFTTHIEGLSRHESDAILELLYRHVVQDEFTVRLNWQPFTVAIWDNRSTQHKPVNDYLSYHRRMHRITIAGEADL